MPIDHRRPADPPRIRHMTDDCGAAQVARTRLRQAPMADGRPKYAGLVHCFKIVWKEEGFIGLYGGLTPHLMRTIPSAAIMFGMYEGVLKLLDARS